MKISINIGFLGFMFLIFLTLKLIGVINWSWWIITLPLWGPIIILSIIIIIIPVLYNIFNK